ncbi:MAG: hypothetical protein JXB14_04685 [Candidatus Altiarchaeota archaeon]|nr:hypothetical protein [Candidatus Altiarchaeota archaeon]
MKGGIFIVGILAVSLFAGCLAEPTNETIVAKFFTIEDCRQCNQERAFLYSLADEYPWFDFIEYNVTNNTYNTELLKNLSSNLGFSQHFFPILVVDRNYQVGFDSPDKIGMNVRVIVEQAYKRLTGPPKPPGPLEKPEEKVVLMQFWRPGCPHCAQEQDELFPYLMGKYPDLVIRAYDVYNNLSARELYFNLSERLNFNPSSVPATVVGDEYYIGYGALETTGRTIEDMVIKAYASLQRDNETNQTDETVEDDSFVVDTPFGRVDLREMGVPLSTVVIGLIDGFNPCAFFVLTMLLSLLVYAKSRKRMLIIGLTFVFISGFVYFLFMTAMYSAIKSLNEIKLLAIIGGVIALTMGVINLKDFFFFKKGVSLTISEDKKPKLYKRMRGLLKAESFIALIVGTIVLAFVVNSYELICTAGLPLVYGNLLNAQQVDFLTSIMYLVLYNFFYVIPLLAIVLFFVKSLGGMKMTQEQGELLKAISGFMMLGFGIILITDPIILQNIFITAGVIGSAVLLSFLLHIAKRSSKAVSVQYPTERRVIVYIVAILFVINGVILAFLSFQSLLEAEWNSLSPTITSLAMLSILGSATSILFAYGLLRRRDWAYGLFMTVCVVLLLTTLLRLWLISIIYLIALLLFALSYNNKAKKTGAGNGTTKESAVH